jgi:hypothetical protein
LTFEAVVSSSQLDHDAVNDWSGVVPEPTNPMQLVLRDHPGCGSYNKPLLAVFHKLKSWEMHGQWSEAAKEILHGSYSELTLAENVSYDLYQPRLGPQYHYGPG